jgi:hypothetical protein
MCTLSFVPPTRQQSALRNSQKQPVVLQVRKAPPDPFYFCCGGSSILTYPAGSYLRFPHAADLSRHHDSRVMAWTLILTPYRHTWSSYWHRKGLGRLANSIQRRW